MSADHELITRYRNALDLYERRIDQLSAAEAELARTPDKEGITYIAQDGTTTPWPNPARMAERRIDWAREELLESRRRLVELSHELEPKADGTDRRAFIALRLAIPRETTEQIEAARVAVESMAMESPANADADSHQSKANTNPILRDGILVIRDVPHKLDASEADVLEAIAEKGAMSGDELQQQSGRSKAVDILKKLKKKYPALKVRLPGAKGKGGYYAHIHTHILKTE